MNVLTLSNFHLINVSDLRFSGPSRCGVWGRALNCCLSIWLYFSVMSVSRVEAGTVPA